jgi:hypothetical protein
LYEIRTHWYNEKPQHLPGGVEKKVSAPSLGLPSQGGPREPDWTPIVGPHLEWDSIPKLIRDWSISTYTVIPITPVTAVLG